MTERKTPRLPPTPSIIRHERFFAELRKASARVEDGALQGKPGDTPIPATMRWVLRFAKTELDILSEGQWSDLRYEVESIAQYGVPWKGLERDKVSMSGTWPIQESDIPKSITKEEDWLLRQLPPQRIIRELQANVRGMIERILDGQRISVSLPPDAQYYAFYVPQEDRVYSGIFVKDRPTAFLCNLLPLLQHYIGRIRRCPGCQAVFLADRRDQTFCQTKCQSRVNMRRYRGTTPERYGRRGRPPKATGFKKEEKDKSSRGRRKAK